MAELTPTEIVELNNAFDNYVKPFTKHTVQGGAPGAPRQGQHGCAASLHSGPGNTASGCRRDPGVAERREHVSGQREHVDFRNQRDGRGDGKHARGLQ